MAQLSTPPLTSMLFLFAVFLLLGVAADLEALDQWAHVLIEDDGGERVEINLPMPLVEKVASTIPRRHRHHHWLLLAQHHLHARDVHRLVVAAENLAAGEWSQTRIRGRRYRVSRHGEDLLLESGAGFFYDEIKARISMPVARALVSGKSNELDWSAALVALAGMGKDNSVTVSDGDESTMKIWVDDRSIQ